MEDERYFQSREDGTGQDTPDLPDHPIGDDSRLTPGSKVFDSEQGRDDSEAWVVEVSDRNAGEYYIEGLGETVAEYNDCPSDETVVEIVFESDVDTMDAVAAEKLLDLGWDGEGTGPGEYARKLAGLKTTTVYPYPRSRLEVIRHV